MKTLKFYGASDDLFEMDGELQEEIGCFRHGAAYHLKASDGEMIVYGLYAPKETKGASWVVGVSLVDEGIPLPPWPMRYETGPANGYPDPQPYSPMLIIETPDDVSVSEAKQ